MKTDLEILKEIEEELKVRFKKEKFNLFYSDKVAFYSIEDNFITGIALTRLNLKIIPNKIFKLKKLKKLNLYLNDIKEIPDEISNLKFLHELVLSYNKIKKLPNGLFNLKFLKKLLLTNNFISKISEEINKLDNLIYLNLDFNQIEELPSNFYKLDSLKMLYLNSNQIINIPKSLSELSILEDISLGKNKITIISDEILKSSNLKIVYLNDNQIKKIPKNISKLNKLEKLYLGNNQIEEIPKEISKLNLNTLWLMNNKIKILPKFLLDMNMKIKLGGGSDILLMGNPLTTPPIEIIKQGNQAILNWFEANKEKLNEIKIILIGDPKAGKTSLLRRLKYNDYKDDEKQTDGINIEDIIFNESETFKNQEELKDITAHFWDFGGQEIMNSTHKFFLTARSIYILLLEARNDNEIPKQIKRWIKRIKATSGDSDIIVVVNKIDENQGFGFTNERELREEFPKIKNFIKISCKDDTNINELKDILEKLIPKAELFNTEIDERWIRIKKDIQDRLREKNIDYLGEKDFKDICKRNNLNDKGKQLEAIRFLHDLGILLHFDNIDLQEYFVIDPYWITYGVYQILTSTLVAKNFGKIDIKNDLDFIINEEEKKEKSYEVNNYEKIDYSSNERRFLIDILSEFKLGLYFNNKKSFIIPDLLKTEEPYNVKDISKNINKIQFIYRYGYLPKSIIPQIIVKLYKKSEIWRTGLIINYKSSKGVISSYDDKIKITLIGDEKSDLLSIIIYIIDSINETLTTTIEKLIPLPNGEYVSHNKLLTRKKRGKDNYIFDEDGEYEEKFDISKLLYGIPEPKEKTIEELMKKIEDFKLENRSFHNKTHSNQEKILNNQDILKEIKENLRFLNKTIELNDSNLINLIEAITNEQTRELVGKINKEFDLNRRDLDSDQRDIFNRLNNVDQSDLKKVLTYIVPLAISLFKISIGDGVDLLKEFTQII